MLDEAVAILESAARYRAGGDSWEDVSVLLKRPVRELKALAWERRREWTALFTEAAGLAALEVLADLAHGPDSHVGAIAARTLLTHSRWAGGESSRGWTRMDPDQDLGRGEALTDMPTAFAAEDYQGSSASICGSHCGSQSEEKIIKAGEAATERLLELLHDEKSWVALRAAQSILVQVRSWWSWTHVRPRAPQREKKPQGIDWKKVLPWKQEDAPPPPDRISIHENSALIGWEGTPERVVAFARPGDSSASWEKTGAEADEYVRELVQGDKPGVEFMWYGHWPETHFVRIAGRDTIPWPPPEEMVSGRAPLRPRRRTIFPKPSPRAAARGCCRGRQCVRNASRASGRTT